MDPALIGAIAAAITGLVGTGIALKNWKRDDTGKEVQQVTMIFDAYKGLIDELQATVKRLVEERDRSLVLLERARRELANFPERIHELESVRDELEAKLAASVAQLTALGEEAQVVADEIKDVADVAEEAANGTD